VAVPQDVPLADAALSGGEHVALRDVVHVDQVETGVEESEHPPAEEIDDHLAGRRRLHVPAAERIGRVDDHDGQPSPRLLVGDALGKELRAVVVTDHVAERDRGRLRARPPAGGNPERADTRREDHPLDAGIRARVEDVSRPLDVVQVERGRIRRPQPVVAGDVKDPPAAGHRAVQPRPPRSPRPTPTPHPASPLRSRPSRASTRTSYPLARRARVMLAPTKPVPPVTRTTMSGALAGRRAPAPRRSAPPLASTSGYSCPAGPTTKSAAALARRHRPPVRLGACRSDRTTDPQSTVRSERRLRRRNLNFGGRVGRGGEA